MSGLFPEPTGPRSDAPWDLAFLRVGALSALAVTAVAVPITGLLAGWTEAAGVLAGAVVVTVFFCVSGLVIAWAGRISDTYTLPAAVGTFGLKAVLLFVLLDALPADSWLDRRALAWAVIVGALLWSAVQLRWVWTRQLYYVPPPLPPVTAWEAPTAGAQDRAAEDPEIRPTRG